AGIPAVSEWGLVIMTALLLMAALVFMRRRRALTV
ncbi:MAG: IPTL-CTERM sorting domain-containing protein, partial [Chloroflexi bacterium]|nr:IPTL-CTERM sorting domain-containing protein [Chloroflexota bacterium]